MRWLLRTLVLISLSVSMAADPFVPEDDAVVLERLPMSSFRDPELRQLRRDLTQDPDNVALAVALGRRYLEIGRADADPRWNGYAQSALALWWNDDDAPPGVLLLRATLKQNRHDFAEALEDLSRLLRAHPRNAPAWLMRAVILQVRGYHRDAYESCRVFQKLDRSLLSRACLANVASFMGQAAASYRQLEHAMRTSVVAEIDDRVWALTSLAQIAERLGRDELAERHYEEALGLDVRDNYLLAAYADFLLDRGRPRDVLRLLEDETRSGALYLRRALAARQLEAPEVGDYVRNLEALFAASRRRGETTHLGSESRFTLQLLGRPTEALGLALRNWQVQKEPVDARLVLEAALAADRPGAARPVLDWLGRSRLEDVRLAGLALRLEEAKELGP